MGLTRERLEKIFEREFKEDSDDFVALCPIHKEKTPSFYVSKDGLVNCFGCKAKGRIVPFVKEYKGVEETEALKMLGLTLEDAINVEFNQMLPPKKDTFPESWLAPFTKGVHKYVTTRGFTLATLDAAGSVYDHHTKRQVFPHRNREGKLVGAIGRSCNNQQPRWYFYWGYEKGRYLYRTPTILESSRRSDKQEVDGEAQYPTLRSIWVVEGVFDALWLYQHGYDAVATLGCKPTKPQIEELKDNYESIIIAYDNDEAGNEGRRYLYSKLWNHIETLFPIWPKINVDIMDVDPKELSLYNAVEGEFIRASD